MSFQGKALGRWGEQQAASYLQAEGYRLCQLNYRCPVGEVDLIVRRGGVIAFVEVKTRRYEAWVPRRKQWAAPNSASCGAARSGICSSCRLRMRRFVSMWWLFMSVTASSPV